MAHFSKAYIDFFKKLDKNNNKPWFDTNKKTYETEVKAAFYMFIDDLITGLKKIHPELNTNAKETVMRINRDIRFSADKSPYKTQMGAMISKYGKKEYSKPGVYIEAGAKHLRLYSGSYMLEKEDLHMVRLHIADNPKEFSKLISDKNFKATFGHIRGEQNKRLPAELEEAAKQQPLIANKQFYFFAEYSPADMVKDDLLKRVLADYKKALPINNFLEKALG